MSKKTDRELGMMRSISRRDVLHGLGAAAAASFVPGSAFADSVMAAENAGELYYPPGLTGLRGNHEGSYDVAHALAREGQRDWGAMTKPDGDDYDLVVVGAGLSGLSAAHFYRKENPNARILLLDNHDDFGGHAKRNEFDVGGHRVIGYGGSQSLQEPNFYPENASTLLKDLGVDLNALGAAYDQDFYKRHDLAAGLHFRKEDWGVDRMLRHRMGGFSYLPFAESGVSPEELVAQMPISDAAKREFLHLLTVDEDQLKMSEEKRYEYLYTHSYRQFLEDYLDVTEPEVFAILQDLTLDMGVGIDATPAETGVGYNGLPSATAAGVPAYSQAEPYIYHYPDGNAGVARLLVRKLIPACAPGSDFEDIVAAPLDYSKLDLAKSRVRLRLNSTAVRVRHDGDPNTAKRVSVDYVNHGQAYRVNAKHCVLACYNGAVPSLCPELPDEQRAALSKGVKSPILYTNVMLKNWRAFKELGIGGAVSSGSYHPIMMLDFPVTFGGQKWPDDPNEPMILHMERFPYVGNNGLPAREQRRLGRYELLATEFETMERNIRQQLTGMLSGADFDPARDIAGITVNRWAHGYADGFYDMEDDWWLESDDERQPYVRGRKPFGRITIANSDAGGSAMFESAVEQAHRAVSELS